MDLFVEKKNLLSFYKKGYDNDKISFLDKFTLVNYHNLLAVTTDYTKSDAQDGWEISPEVKFNILKADKDAFVINVGKIVPILNIMLKSSLTLNGMGSLIDMFLKEEYKGVKYISIEELRTIIESARRASYSGFTKEMENDLIKNTKELNPDILNDIITTINEIVGEADEF